MATGLAIEIEEIHEPAPHEQIDAQRRIQKRAHQFFVERGREHGHDVEDWLRAEREIAAEDTQEQE